MKEYDINPDIESAIEAAYTADIIFDEPDGKFDFKVKKGWYLTSQKDTVMKYARSRRVEAIVKAVFSAIYLSRNYNKYIETIKYGEILRRDLQVKLDAETAKLEKLQEEKKRIFERMGRVADLLVVFAGVSERYVTDTLADDDIASLIKEVERLCMI